MSIELCQHYIRGYMQFRITIAKCVDPVSASWDIITIAVPGTRVRLLCQRAATPVVILNDHDDQSEESKSYQSATPAHSHVMLSLRLRCPTEMSYAARVIGFNPLSSNTVFFITIRD